MKKLVLILLLFGFITNLNAMGSEKISAGYNSNGDKVYLTMDYYMLANFALKGVSKKFVAKTWLNICAPANIFKGKIVKYKNIDDDIKLYIDYKWKSFGSGSSEMVVILDKDSKTYTVECIDSGI